MIGSHDPGTGSGAWAPLIWTIALADVASAWILTRPAPFSLTGDAGMDLVAARVAYLRATAGGVAAPDGCP